MSTDTTQAPSQPQLIIPPDPHAAEQAEFASDLEAITREIENEFNSSRLSDEIDGDDADPTAGDPAPETQDKPAEDPKDQDDPAVARGLDRLVAREVALKVREDAAVQAETRAQALIAEAKKYESLKPTAEIQELFDYDPMAAVKSLGKDPMETVRLLLAQTIEAQGKPVPQELAELNRKAQDRRRDAAANKRFAEMERKLAAKDAELAGQTYFNSVNASARQYVTTMGDSTPTVKAVATANPDLVHAEILEEIGRDAQVKAAKDPSAPLLTFDEAAKRIEDRWSKLKGAISPVQAGTDPTKNASGAKKIIPPQIKPAAKPILPWMAKSTSDLETQGLQEALREYSRAEAASKRR